MEWRDQGILLSARRHGETSAIIEVFTAGHGRHAGVVRGGSGRRMGATLQPGTQLDLVWRARLDQHLGTFQAELLQSRAAALMADRLSLAGLNAVVALLSMVLPEREPHAGLYADSIALVDAVAGGAGDPGWIADYLRWELAILEEMGFGLDLDRCAVTGGTEALVHVSPKSGRAVSRDGAGDWADRLLPLPACLRGTGPAAASEVAAGLVTTGYFLTHRLVPELGQRAMPAARQRLVDMVQRLAAG